MSETVPGLAHVTVMYQDPAQPGDLGQATAEVVADLLDLVVAHNASDGLSDLERVVARLRMDADEVSAARAELRRTSADVLRDALALRAARSGSHFQSRYRHGGQVHGEDIDRRGRRA